MVKLTKHVRIGKEKVAEKRCITYTGTNGASNVGLGCSSKKGVD